MIIALCFAIVLVGLYYLGSRNFLLHVQPEDTLLVTHVEQEVGSSQAVTLVSAIDRIFQGDNILVRDSTGEQVFLTVLGVREGDLVVDYD